MKSTSIDVEIMTNIYNCIARRKLFRGKLEELQNRLGRAVGSENAWVDYSNAHNKRIDNCVDDVKQILDDSHSASTDVLCQYAASQSSSATTIKASLKWKEIHAVLALVRKQQRDKDALE